MEAGRRRHRTCGETLSYHRSAVGAGSLCGAKGIKEKGSFLLSSGKLAAFDESCFHLVERNTLLAFARPGHEHVFNIFPKLPMAFEVDLNGHFTALLVRYVLDSGHGSILPQIMASTHSTRTPVQLQIAHPRQKRAFRR